MRVKLIVALVIAAGAAAIFLLSSSGAKSSSVYYYSPTEYLSKPEMAKERLRLKGDIQPGSVTMSKDRMDLAFKVTDGAKEIPVHYSGVIPDSFQEGLEVVVDGRMSEKGVFEGRELIVKCPSKYESGDQKPGPAAAAPTHPQEAPAK